MMNLPNNIPVPETREPDKRKIPGNKTKKHIYLLHAFFLFVLKTNTKSSRIFLFTVIVIFLKSKNQKSFRTCEDPENFGPDRFSFVLTFIGSLVVIFFDNQEHKIKINLTDFISLK